MITTDRKSEHIFKLARKYPWRYKIRPCIVCGELFVDGQRRLILSCSTPCADQHPRISEKKRREYKEKYLDNYQEWRKSIEVRLNGTLY